VPSEGADVTRDRGRRRPLLYGAIVLGVVAVDQATKAWAVSELPGAPVSIIGDDVELRLTRNTGGAFSLFQGYTPLLVALALVITVLLIRAVRRANDPVTAVALSLILAGAFGNLGDRLFRSPGFGRGAVVDFVRLGWWPTFNVADASVTTGAVLLILWTLFGPRHEERARTRGTTSGSDASGADPVSGV
jgi:signal peptidase II